MTSKRRGIDIVTLVKGIRRSIKNNTYVSDYLDYFWEEEAGASQIAFKELKGQTFHKVRRHLDSLWFYTDTHVYIMFHLRDCCETVVLEDVCGDLKDLLDSPIIETEEVSRTGDSEDGTATWTFYKLGTRKGSVTLRWYGESNGYYSEAVDLLMAPIWGWGNK